MIWQLTYLFINIGALLGFVMLYGQAPDFWQKLVIAWLSGAMLILAVSRIYALSGIEGWEAGIAFGRSCEHVGLLVYAFRLFMVEQARQCLQKLSESSSR